jgi:hypothetical protein
MCCHCGGSCRPRGPGCCVEAMGRSSRCGRDWGRPQGGGDGNAWRGGGLGSGEGAQSSTAGVTTQGRGAACGREEANMARGGAQEGLMPQNQVVL